jgi:peptide/nickel transport system substrate-binding protein
MKNLARLKEVVNDAKRLRLVARVALACLAMVTAMTLAPSSGVAEPSGELKIASPAKVRSFDPHGTDGMAAGTGAYLNALYDTLTVLTKTGAAPSIATGWEASPKELRFKIRNDVSFSDGRKLTAKDVVASYDRIIRLKGAMVPLYASVERAEATDDSTVVFHMAKPDRALPLKLSLLRVLPAGGPDEAGFFDKPVGSGPFVFESFTRDQQLVLKANPNYWQGAPKVGRLVFKEIPEVSSRLTALEAGEVDVTWGVPFDQLPRVESMYDVKAASAFGFGYAAVWINSSKPPFNDVRVRQALTHAINFAPTVGSLYGKTGRLMKSSVPEATFAFAKQTPYAYDPEAAKKLLANAGYPNGYSTSIEFSSATLPSALPLAQAIASDLSKVGVKVQINQLELAEWTSRSAKLDFNLGLIGTSMVTGEPGYSLGRLLTCKPGRIGYCNEEYDRLVASAITEIDADAQANLWAQIQKIAWDEAPMLFVLETSVTYAYRDSVKDLGIGVENTPRFEKVSVK